jgi:hypothetical protein
MNTTALVQNKNPHYYGCASRAPMKSTLVSEYIVPVYLWYISRRLDLVEVITKKKKKKKRNWFERSE